jgi:DNA-binding transcriptional LysR family regulator
MELRHLRYFVAVADVLHFGRAAARLQIAQPSLSHQIRQLEAELQTTLLHRTKRRVQLTEAGRVFLQEARDILAHADRAAVHARRASRGDVGTLRVGFAYWMDPTNIIAAVGSFNRRNPAIQVDLCTIPPPLQVLALRDERLDVGFVRPPISESSLSSEILLSEPFVVALPANHRLAMRDRIPLAAFTDESFVIISRATVPVFYDLVLKISRDAEFVPRASHETDQPEIVLGMVAAGMGISLIPASFRKFRRRGLVFRSLRESPPILQTAIAWRREHTPPMVNEFLNHARRVFADSQQRMLS